MKKFMILATMASMVLGVSAKEVADSAVENFKRSSLYTIILKSDKQNKYFEEETKKAEANSDGLVSLAKSFVKKDGEENVNLFELPAQVFPNIPIPSQFNDHNLDVRVLDFDELKGNVTDAELAQYAPKKKSGGGFLGKMAKSAAGMETAGDDINAEFDNYAPAVLAKFFNTQNVPAGLIAKWFAYDENRPDNRWALDLIEDRGLYNFSKEDIMMAANDPALKAKISQTGYDMVNDTYVMAINLRFRSNQAIAQEAGNAAKAIGGMFGGAGALIGSAASAIGGVAAGEGYAVQAVTNLYKLKWNEDIENVFAEDIVGKNLSLQDLIDKGICELEFIGKESARSNVRQSITSKKPMSDLVRQATTKAIDKAIVELQNHHEQFRTAFPVVGGDGNGAIYARIGTKEGLNEKDEYEILEKQEDANGKTIYKSVGSVKAVKGKIMNNEEGAAEELDEKSSAADREAVERDYTEFKGKKGDYRGYYLRLKKKK